ncbi:hypothetical protein swp_3971 [Shewanella piezotolerans WP3]|uniref:Uncharacterized protein n=1 Tax=Shewanella piezotolerans (strain WP3 / JCM 13877) TaxID=225849 RepID=B8CSL5_SHEPW|nr:hypothetical protein [Shewanella piezotolerans]ACJ30641.1 hypothetical protein swp_3971 [Shewanella piezotolerans WP3]
MRNKPLLQLLSSARFELAQQAAYAFAGSRAHNYKEVLFLL